jgi:hypothetical protein
VAPLPRERAATSDARGARREERTWAASAVGWLLSVAAAVSNCDISPAVSCREHPSSPAGEAEPEATNDWGWVETGGPKHCHAIVRQPAPQRWERPTHRYLLLSLRGFGATAVSVRCKGKSARQKRATARAPSPSSCDASLTQRECLHMGGAAARAPSAERLRELN